MCSIFWCKMKTVMQIPPLLKMFQPQLLSLSLSPIIGFPFPECFWQFYIVHCHLVQKFMYNSFFHGYINFAHNRQLATYLNGHAIVWSWSHYPPQSAHLDQTVNFSIVNQLNWVGLVVLWPRWWTLTRPEKQRGVIKANLHNGSQVA